MQQTCPLGPWSTATVGKMAQRRRVPKMLRVISRPRTVAADRAMDRKAEDSITFSAVDFSGFGARVLRGAGA